MKNSSPRLGKKVDKNRRIRAITLEVAKLCKKQKVFKFTHFNSKNTHISACKIVHIYKNASAYMHGHCSFFYNILLISLFLSLLCLCPSQVVANPPNYVHPNLLQIHPTLPNHHSITTTTNQHNSSQPMIFRS